MNWIGIGPGLDFKEGCVKRREFISVIGGAAVAWPLAAYAQEPGRVYRVGFLVPAERQAPAVVALFDELRLNGFAEGMNLTVISGGFDAAHHDRAGTGDGGSR
jgi:hypothetical protein